MKATLDTGPWVALDTGIQNIVTFDIKDFTIYPFPGKKKFNILP